MHSKKTRDRAADARLRREYQITLEEYNLIIEHQKGCCAICRRPPKGARLAVDHNHITGEVRGLLCMQCNRALGKWRDNNQLVAYAYAYVLNYPATEALKRLHITAPGRIGTKKRAKLLKKLLGSKFKSGVK